MSINYGNDIQKVTAQMKADSYKMAALSLEARNNILKNVKEALLKAGREDLIGFDKKCLIRPRNMQGNVNYSSIQSKGSSQGKHSAKDNSQKKVSRKENSAKGNLSKKSSGGLSDNRNQNNRKTIRNIHKKKQK